MLLFCVAGALSKRPRMREAVWTESASARALPAQKMKQAGPVGAQVRPANVPSSGGTFAAREGGGMSPMPGMAGIPGIATPIPFMRGAGAAADRPGW